MSDFDLFAAPVLQDQQMNQNGQLTQRQMLPQQVQQAIAMQMQQQPIQQQPFHAMPQQAMSVPMQQPLATVSSMPAQQSVMPMSAQQTRIRQLRPQPRAYTPQQPSLIDSPAMSDSSTSYSQSQVFEESSVRHMTTMLDELNRNVTDQRITQVNMRADLREVQTIVQGLRESVQNAFQIFEMSVRDQLQSIEDLVRQEEHIDASEEHV